LQAELGLEHVLASKALYTDGAEVLYDFAEREGDTLEARSARQLVVVRKGQHVFAELIDEYLHRIEFAGDDYAQVIHLPEYRDDMGSVAGSETPKLANRARQNVLLELGYFMGTLGRSRVVALCASAMERPSDIHGLLYIDVEAGGLGATARA
jgi:predicted nucleotide-binding protein